MGFLHSDKNEFSKSISTKHSGLNFSKFPVAIGTAFSGIFVKEATRMIFYSWNTKRPGAQ